MKRKVVSKPRFIVSVAIVGLLGLNVVTENLGLPSLASLKPLLGICSLPEVIAFELFPVALLVIAWYLFFKSVSSNTNENEGA